MHRTGLTFPTFKYPLILQACQQVFNIDLEEAYLLRPSNAQPSRQHVARQAVIEPPHPPPAQQQKEPQNLASARLDLQSMGLSPHAIEGILGKIGKQQSQQPQPSPPIQSIHPTPRSSTQALSGYGYQPSHAAYHGMADMGAPASSGQFFNGPTDLYSAHSIPGIPAPHVYVQEPSAAYAGYFASAELSPAIKQQAPKPPPKSSKPNANLEPMGSVRRIPAGVPPPTGILGNSNLIA